jgi:hypothetical protein
VIKSRRTNCVGHAARKRKIRKVKKRLVGKPKGKGPFGKPRRRREDNIKRDLK